MKGGAKRYVCPLFLHQRWGHDPVAPSPWIRPCFQGVVIYRSGTFRVSYTAKGVTLTLAKELHQKQCIEVLGWRAIDR